MRFTTILSTVALLFVSSAMAQGPIQPVQCNRNYPVALTATCAVDLSPLRELDTAKTVNSSAPQPEQEKCRKRLCLLVRDAKWVRSIATVRRAELELEVKIEENHGDSGELADRKINQSIKSKGDIAQLGEQ
ncbi:hypothetical protein NP233_g8275 [Leucocoprinus birnbaumii]|uniref:Uncharacterized protein n=1 Tax=Leucocoprinus birnbaumii TaxID=56174 RepID=A0AAD5YNA9_9AGAR|nr:hypothetical protein NP233_g8275 [Leucocoprinus birnbaumii]